MGNKSLSSRGFDFFKSRIGLLPDFMFHGLKKAATDILMSGGDLIVYTQGLYTGESLAGALRERFREELPTIENTLNLAEDAFKRLGWGILKFNEINPRTKTGSIVVRESMEHAASSTDKCHFVRGLITGMLRQMLSDETIDIRDIKCESRGDPHCEYRFV